MDRSPSGEAKGVTAGGRIRRAAIFVCIAAVFAGGIWILLPRRAPEPSAPPAPPPEAPVSPEAPPAKLPEVRENTPAPDADPETVSGTAVSPSALPSASADGETTVEKADPKPVDTAPPAPPVRKGVAHPSDPADEAPYVAPDALEPGGFAENLRAIRQLLNDGKTDIAGQRIRALLAETAFASAQFREGAKLLNGITRASAPTEEKTETYVVQPGDSLIRLARKFHVSTVRLAAGNGLAADALLKIGQKLRIPAGAAAEVVWSVRISKRARLLRVWRGDALTAVYDVGIGRRGLTPEGTFVVRETVDDPPYPKPEGGVAPAGSPENQLGACWLGLGDRQNRATGYGIHGTPDEASVTKDLSAGCVRMRNAEVRELRAMIPVGTMVVIEH